MNNSRRACFFVMLLLVLSSSDLLAQTNSTWNRKNAEAWYKKHEWLNDQKASEPTVKYDQFGRIIESPQLGSNDTKISSQQKHLRPHESIDQVEFARQYHAHKLWWDEAFAYIKNTDLASLKVGDHPVVGEDVFARVTEGPLKSIDSSRWEAHKNYADIHYVIKGREKIGIGELSKAKLVEPYNSTRDISFYDGKGKYYIAEPGTYFIAFTHQIHRPGLEVNGKETEKKVVIKVRTSKRSQPHT